MRIWGTGTHMLSTQPRLAEVSSETRGICPDSELPLLLFTTAQKQVRQLCHTDPRFPWNGHVHTTHLAPPLSACCGPESQLQSSILNHHGAPLPLVRAPRRRNEVPELCGADIPDSPLSHRRHTFLYKIILDCSMIAITSQNTRAYSVTLSSWTSQ